MDQGAFLQGVLERQPQPVCALDAEQRISLWNPAAEKLTGIPASRVLQVKWSDAPFVLLSPGGEPLPPEESPVTATFHGGDGREREILLEHSDGHRIPVLISACPLTGAGGETVGVVTCIYDNSQKAEWIRRLQEVEEQVLLCPLTLVGNRRYATIFLHERFEEWRRHGTTFGVIFFKIDQFDAFNDRYGLAVGDVILKMVANTLRHNVRPFDFVGRWSGDEFIVAMPKVTSPQLLSSTERLRHFILSTARSLTQGKSVINLSAGSATVTTDDTLDSVTDRAQKQRASDSIQGKRSGGAPGKPASPAQV